MTARISPEGGLKYLAEQAVGAVVLYVLFGGICVLYQEDERVKEEIDSWKDGMVYCLECSPGGPFLMFGKKGRRLYRLVPDEKAADTCIRFKHMGEAFKVLMGMEGIAGSYAAHGFALKGDISSAMTFSRVVDLVESYLFPRVMTKRILKEVAQKETYSLAIYGKILVGAVLGKYRKHRVNRKGAWGNGTTGK